MTVYLLIPLPKTPFIHRTYMVLANPNLAQRKNYAGSETTPHMNLEKGATLAPGTVNFITKKKKNINGDQEDCRLGRNSMNLMNDILGNWSIDALVVLPHVSPHLRVCVCVCV
jgi:hypothetical protein